MPQNQSPMRSKSRSAGDERPPSHRNRSLWRDGWARARAAARGRPLRAAFTAAVAAVALAFCLLWTLDSALPQEAPSSSMAARPEEQAEDTSQTQKTPKKHGQEKSKKKGTPDESSKERSRAEPPSTSGGQRSYSFVGSVSKDIPETQSRTNASSGGSGSSSTSASPGGKSGKGDSRTRKEGQVPELTIQVTGENIASIADRFDYQMVAITASGDAILGKVERGSLRRLSKEELSRYARRARSARQHPSYRKILRRVAQQVGRGAGSMRLIYLVPKAVEDRFVKAQMRALDRRGLAHNEVAKMEARPKGRSIEITDITLK